MRQGLGPRERIASALREPDGTTDCGCRAPQLHLVSIGATEEGLGALAETLMPKVGGLPALRLLHLDEAHLGHARLKEAHVARNGLGGVHSFKLLAS